MPGAASPFAALQQQRMRRLYEEQNRSTTDEAGREEDIQDVGHRAEPQGQQPNHSTHGYHVPGRQTPCTKHNSSYKGSVLRRSLLIQTLRPASVELQRLPVPQHPEPRDGPHPAPPGAHQSGLPWADLAIKCHALAEEEQYGQDMHDASSGRSCGSGHSSPREYQSADEQEAEEDGEQDGDEVSSEDDEEGWEDSRLYWEEVIGKKLWASRVRGCRARSINEGKHCVLRRAGSSRVWGQHWADPRGIAGPLMPLR